MSELRRKLVIVGDGACGKTCLLIVFSKGTFPEVYVPTVFENYVADVEVDGRHVELALWDTAGQEDYDRLRPLSYPDSHVILICFAVDSPDSLDNVQEKWISEVLHFCQNLPIILVGCKKDLRHDPRIIEELRKTSQRPVTPDEGMAVASKIGAVRYLECSAKTGEGVREVFEHATRAALIQKPRGSRGKSNVSTALQDKAAELGRDFSWSDLSLPLLPHLSLHGDSPLDLANAARKPPALHQLPDKTSRCTSSPPKIDKNGALRQLVQYAMMIDAGSTGSRIHVYKFNYCGASPELESEVFEHVEPGLSSYINRDAPAGSSYAGDAARAAHSLRPLLDAAKKTIPQDLWRYAPVTLKATAGLRLLPGTASSEVIKAARSLLENEYPFPVADSTDESGHSLGDGVEIMNGRDEGVYAWITVNYLLNLIGAGDVPTREHKGKNGRTRRTAAVLDLGGGSTQIVFEPQSQGNIDLAMQPGEHVYKLHDFEGESFTLYQKSYLGYGLKEARTAVNSLVAFAHTLRHPDTIRPDNRFADVLPWTAMSPNNTEIPSPCFAKGTRKTVKIRQPEESREAEVTFVGTDGGFDACRRLVEVMIDKDAVCHTRPCSFAGEYQPSMRDTFSHSSIIALSYFYDRIAPLGLGPTFTIKELKTLAERVCAPPENWDKESPPFSNEALEELRGRPEHCLDLTYMYSLFSLGYELDGSRYITLAKKIGDFELGWALGAQLAVLQQGVFYKDPK
ncbi:guanosine-diphosphatase [Malassezia cuniculi]|uniref:guanosine-diphosphatase n=1 Tax=Malassezia cuniculi TaxID=948313 RepID=A0AAF0J543_9BASI|nr:guanosine-diphosphatase [Malassezia cuniculi]